MTTYDLLFLVVVIVIAVIVLVAVCVDRLREVPWGIARRILLGIAVYLLHGALGIAALLYLRPILSNAPAAAGGAMTALLGWFGLGLHVLLGLVPSEKPKPRWMQRFGVFDIACLLALVGGAGVAAGFI
jgi:hypothetical protein